MTLAVTEGSLPLAQYHAVAGCRGCTAPQRSAAMTSRWDRPHPITIVFTFTEEIIIHAGEELVLLA